MADLPYFPFYVGDYLADPNVRRCTHEQKGILLEVRCYAHGSDDYGILRWPLKEIAHIVSCKVTDLNALVRNGVLKGADPGDVCEPFTFTPRHAGADGTTITIIPSQLGPIWFSPTMIREKYKRDVKGAKTRFKAKDSEDGSPHPTPCPRQGDELGDESGDGYSVSVSVSVPSPLLRTENGLDQGRDSSEQVTTTTKRKKRSREGKKFGYGENTRAVVNAVMGRDFWPKADPDGRKIVTDLALLCVNVDLILQKHPEVTPELLIEAARAYVGKEKFRYRAPQYFFGRGKAEDDPAPWVAECHLATHLETREAEREAKRAMEPPPLPPQDAPAPFEPPTPTQLAAAVARDQEGPLPNWIKTAKREEAS